MKLAYQSRNRGISQVITKELGRILYVFARYPEFFIA